MQNPSNDLTLALSENQELVTGKRPPSRYDVRAFFIPLGALILEGDMAGLAPTLEHLSSFIQPESEAWSAAVAEELNLAGEEFCQSVDPRFLDLANYDFDYTEHSRETLECRLRAAEHMGFTAPMGLRERIEAADEVLEPYLDRRDGA